MSASADALPPRLLHIGQPRRRACREIRHPHEMCPVFGLQNPGGLGGQPGNHPALQQEIFRRGRDIDRQGAAAGLTEYFASYFRAHPLGRGDMPQLDDTALVRLAAGMTVLAGLPDYAPYLVRYGLTGKVDATGNQGGPA